MRRGRDPCLHSSVWFYLCDGVLERMEGKGSDQSSLESLVCLIRGVQAHEYECLRSDNGFRVPARGKRGGGGSFNESIYEEAHCAV
jgi:hypothetical protein